MNERNKNRYNVVVVIPTYNEVNNITNLIDKINTVSIRNDYNLNILIVDGKSNDGTGDVVRDKMKSTNNLHLFVETEKGGLGSAYYAGFSYAIRKLDAEIIFEFDGDFQHPPEMIPIMIDKIHEGYDYVIGSRFINGGKDMRNESVFRRILSLFGGYLARLILFFPNRYFFQITDPTSGLRATRVSGFMDRLNLDTNHLYSKKFGYKIQLLSETIRLRPKYTEVPLIFQEREKGESKIEAGTAFEILMSAIRSRLSL